MHGTPQGIDKDQSGTITVEELKEGLREQGSMVAEEELSELVANLDADQSGTIDYEVHMLAAQVKALKPCMWEGWN